GRGVIGGLRDLDMRRVDDDFLVVATARRGRIVVVVARIPDTPVPGAGMVGGEVGAREGRDAVAVQRRGPAHTCDGVLAARVAVELERDVAARFVAIVQRGR